MDALLFQETTNLVCVAHYRIFTRSITMETARTVANEILKQRKFPPFMVQWLDHLNGEEIHPTVTYLADELAELRASKGGDPISSAQRMPS